jgi:hypothetical protein
VAAACGGISQKPIVKAQSNDVPPDRAEHDPEPGSAEELFHFFRRARFCAASISAFGIVRMNEAGRPTAMIMQG